MMQQHLKDLDALTLQAAFLHASKEFTEAAKKRMSIDELSRMFDQVKELYDQLNLKKRAQEEPVWS